METLSAAMLGIIQGLTEFLPVSSSAHLILVPWFLGWTPEGIFFDVSLHLGTAIAVIAYFWNDWVHLAREVVIGLRSGRPFGNSDRKLAWYLIVGTLPAAVLGLSFEELVGDKLRSPLVTAFTLVGLALLLYYAENRSRQNRSLETYNWGDSLWIGLSQALALIPGVSRSGITITAALLRDSKRSSAARFSFLLSTPIIVGAALLEGWRFFEIYHRSATATPEVEWDVLIVGTLFASVTGFLCIRYFLRYVQNKGFLPFVIYRCALGAAVLILYYKYHTSISVVFTGLGSPR